MSIEPKISIIIPVYNTEVHIKEAIESVINQDFEDFELILVDDGSTDNSLKICNTYQHHHNIKIIEQSNSGVSIARNNGLKIACGKYIFFMDADDTIAPDFLSTTYKVAESKSSDIVVIGEYFKKRFPYVYALPTCAMFLRHSFLKKYPDIRFPKGIQPCEDGLFSHQLLALTSKIGFNPKGMYHYRKHSSQNHIAINKQTKKVLQQIPEWFTLLEKFYTKHQLFEAKALHLALFIQHEPFELRYLSMPFKLSEKEKLFKMVQSFMVSNVTPFLNKNERNLLSPIFIQFYTLPKHETFLKLTNKKAWLKQKIINLIRWKQNN